MEGPSDEDVQTTPTATVGQQNGFEEDEQEVMMGNGGNGVPNGVSFHPTDGELLNILFAKIFGYDYPTTIYIKVIDQNPRALGFFEPNVIREYCSMEGSEDQEEQQECYFLIQPAAIGGPLLSGLTGLWKMKEGSRRKYSREGELECGERLTFEFSIEDPNGLADSSPDNWILYEYIIYMPPLLAIPSNQVWRLYRLSSGEVSDTSSTDSEWSQLDDDSSID